MKNYIVLIFIGFLLFIGCSKDLIDQILDDYEQLIDKHTKLLNETMSKKPDLETDFAISLEISDELGKFAGTFQTLHNKMSPKQLERLEKISTPFEELMEKFNERAKSEIDNLFDFDFEEKE